MELEPSGALARMQTICAGAIDRAVLRVMEKAWRGDRPPARDAWDVYAAPALLAEPRSFYPEPAAAEPERRVRGQLTGGRIERLRWSSGYRTYDRTFQPEYDRYAANRTAHAELLRHDGEPRPVVLVLHAWMGGATLALERRLSGARALYDAGLDVALLALPFHGPRTPVEARFGGELFPSGCPRRTNEGFGQLVWDARALLRWLAARGAPVGVAGISIGGYATALLAGVERRLAFAVPIIPMVDMPELMWHHARGRELSLRRATGGATLDEMRALYAVHSPLRHPPLVPRERRMIVAGRGDHICRREHVLSLWEHWDRPRLQWWPGGHVAHFGRAPALRALARFLHDTLSGGQSRESR